MARKVQNIFIIALLIITSISITSFKLIGNSNYHIRQEDQTKIHASQGSQNFTIDTYLPSLVWVDPQLRLNISVNQTGQIQCLFRETAGQLFFSSGNYSLSLVGNNISQIFYLQVVPLITTLPGVYQFSLNITGVFSYSENFEIVYALGVIPLILIFLVIIIVPIIILVKKPKGVKVKEMATVDEYVPTRSTIAGKINCPKCRKSIDEGLTFCPECGERIPEFLRYNAPSGI
ncbi:MAG: zinc ribbon domain-containing protein [Candidatus Lokiarchaeota archaeon]|nr:zinc ribbon domain-containing protein [Candidatus Lokiarchaeota archaeon]